MHRIREDHNSIQFAVLAHDATAMRVLGRLKFANHHVMMPVQQRLRRLQVLTAKRPPKITGLKMF
jgi:hypothetical protein